MDYNDEIISTPQEYYMQECFELAKQGLGRTSPNPIVGAIVLDKNGNPTGKGYHKKAGEPHAEVIAIKEAGDSAKDGTLIVNLEPCCHVGRTPPCTDLIIDSQIKIVIFSNFDPNPLVNKKGEKILLEKHIKVISQVLEKNGYELNKFYFKWIKTGLPWITLKQAQTLDGKVSLNGKGRVLISGELAVKEVHKLRNYYDAILVGANTVLTDNPELTVRNLNDIQGTRNPIRIILDPSLTTKPDANVYKSNSEVFLVTNTGHPKEKINNYLNPDNKHIKILELPKSRDKNGKIDLRELFYELGKKEIVSVLVEAGPKLASKLILNNLLDEYVLFISPKLFGDNLAIPGFKKESFQNIDNEGKIKEFCLFDYKAIGNDLMVLLRPI